MKEAWIVFGSEIEKSIEKMTVEFLSASARQQIYLLIARGGLGLQSSAFAELELLPLKKIWGIYFRMRKSS